MTKRTIKIFALILLLAAGLCVPAAAADDSTPYNVILSWTGDTSTTQTFAWRDHAEKAGYVQVVASEKYSKTGFSDAMQFGAECRDISLDGSGAWHYEATASNLSPATAYCYRVGSEGAWSTVLTFTTADVKPNAFSFLYMCDIHIGVGSDRDWKDLLAGAYASNPDVAFGLFGGDIVDNGTNMDQWNTLLGDASPVFSQIPLMPANGNHESNFIGGKPELYLDVFALPKNGPEGFSEEFYSFDYENCHVLVLNSWVYSGEQDLSDEDYASISNWIAKDLSESKADWQIVVTHVPVYAVHSDTTATALKEHWAPLFEKYGVDLVLVGHQHVYSRSYPMYEGRMDYEKGIPYIMGNAGQKFYDSADEMYSERTIYNTSTYELVRADGNSLTVQAFNAAGDELDYCTVAQRPAYLSLPTFTDVSDTAWYKTAVDYAASNALMTGTSEQTFSPDMTLDRAQFAAILWRMAGCPKASVSAEFSDVQSGAWYADAADWACAKGMMSGYGDGRFGAADAVTREQLAAILYRYEGSPAPKSTVSLSFSDTTSVSSWAADAMAWANANGIIEGAGGRLDPQGSATRAQTAQILMKYIN